MNGLVKTFDARVGTLGGLDGQSVADLLHAASDVALIVDRDGIIRDISFSADAHLEETRAWLGQAWVDTVTPETRDKVREMLQEVTTAGASPRRQVNHVAPGGIEFPVAYTAVRLGSGPNLVAIGRDLRGLAVLQQRLVEAQQAMERDYWRMRHIETRYRLLFQLSSEAVLVVDVATMKIIDANPAAGRLFAVTPKRLIGRTFPLDLTRESERTVEELLATVRSSGRSEEAPVRLDSQQAELRIGVSLVRQDGSSLFLVRLLPLHSEPVSGGEEGRLHEVLRDMPDAFMVTDPEGKVLLANRAFLDLAQLATEEQARGQLGGRWLGRPGADLQVLLATLREHGVARLFSTSVRGEYGSVAEVEVSAVMAPPGTEPCVGLVIRDVGRRLASGPQGARDLTRAVEQLTELVGRVALKDLVRDTTDLVERHFIEAALELTGHNRTSAAEVLGVSRQSLYVKLRRYQLLIQQEGGKSGGSKA
jgi:transcriptional regulator PpsR